jgi:hypothetical protein
VPLSRGSRLLTPGYGQPWSRGSLPLTPGYGQVRHFPGSF